MKIMLVTGGSCNQEFLKNVYREYCPDYLIGADRGLVVIKDLGLTPDLVVGDFDSLDPVLEEYYTQKVRTIRLLPEKDETDTHTAFQEALDLNPDSIIILGGTGTRLDHTMANVSLLKQACERNVLAFLMDEHNVVRVIKDSCVIERKESYGDFLSVMPLGDFVTGLTMQGVKYKTDNITLTQGISLGISNEIVEDRAYISIDKGFLIVMETRD